MQCGYENRLFFSLYYEHASSCVSASCLADCALFGAGGGCCAWRPVGEWRRAMLLKRVLLLQVTWLSWPHHRPKNTPGGPIAGWPTKRPYRRLVLSPKSPIAGWPSGPIAGWSYRRNSLSPVGLPGGPIAGWSYRRNPHRRVPLRRPIAGFSHRRIPISPGFLSPEGGHRRIVLSPGFKSRR